jgi:TolA-binding protein
MHYQRGELEQAETAIQQAIAKYDNPSYAARATGYLGKVYEKQGKRQEAMEAYRKAIGWWFDDTLAREGLERLEKGQ